MPSRKFAVNVYEKTGPYTSKLVETVGPPLANYGDAERLARDEQDKRAKQEVRVEKVYA